MRVDATWLVRGLQYALENALRILDRRITFEDNVSQVTLQVVAPATPSTTFEVAHNLGRKPQRWLANPEEDARVWSVETEVWDEQKLLLRCSGSSTPMTLTVW